MSDFTMINPLENEYADLDLNFGESNKINHPIFAEIKLKINNTSLEENIEIITQDENFGILDITLSKTIQTTQPIYLKLDIDTSSSMTDLVSNNKTKINFVQKTIESMSNFIAERPELMIYINISSFDTFYHTVIPTTRITMNNKSELITKINDLKVDGSTNIEQTFLESSRQINKYKIENPTHKIVYILLTDGNPTSGKTSKNYLKSIKPDASNKCIGYGSDHNVSLLNSCGEYYFINDYENTGKIYGEILHKIIYPGLENIKISVKNGYIYDSVKNSWESSITENEMYSEQKRTFHWKMDKNEKIEFNICGKVIGTLENETKQQMANQDIRKLYTIKIDEDTTTYTDLRKYMFRQKTQELLFESIEESKHRFISNNNKYKEKLNIFFKKMRSFMRNNDLLEDSFMKLLCDDIYVAFKTFGKEYAEMYSISRHQSQSNQTPHRVTSSRITEEEYIDSYNKPNNILRQRTTFNTQLFDEEIVLDDIHNFEDDFNDENNDLQNSDDPDNLYNYKPSLIKEDIYVEENIINTMQQISNYN